MSGVTIPFKKAIPIVVVTWILSLITTLTLIYFVPKIFPQTWNETQETIYTKYRIDYLIKTTRN